MQTLSRCPFSDQVQAVDGEPKEPQGCMRTPYTHNLPIQMLTLETLNLCSVFFISVHLSDLDEQKLDQECIIYLSWLGKSADVAWAFFFSCSGRTIFRSHAALKRLDSQLSAGGWVERLAAP